MSWVLLCLQPGVFAAIAYLMLMIADWRGELPESEALVTQ